MAHVLKGLPRGVVREKMKFNDRYLRMSINRLGGYAPIRSKVKIKTENISRIVWGDSDRIDSRILGAIKGKTIVKCIYVTANVGLTGRTKTFRFEILQQYLISKKIRTRDIEEAIGFARVVATAAGLRETMLADGSIVWTRDAITENPSDLIARLDEAANDLSDDAQFQDGDPDED